MNTMQTIIWQDLVDSSWQLNFIYEYSYVDQSNPAILNERSLRQTVQKARNELDVL